MYIVAQTIADLFDGEVGQFLSEGEVIFGSIQDLLAEQFARLSELEQTVLRWLVIMRESATIDELLALLVSPLPRMQLLAAVDGLRRRSLIERGKRQASFTLQSVVMEYVTALLIEEATNEIQQGRLDQLTQHGLEQAEACEYVRQTQQRLLVAPILARLRRVYQGRAEVEEQLLWQLDQLRQRADYAQGYGPATLLALLRQQRGHLSGLDLSNVSMWGAYLQGIDLQDTTLSGATIRDTVFTDAFDAVWTLAISSNGTFWAVGGRRGEVRVWRARWQVAGQGGHDQTVRLWEIASGHCRASMEGHTSFVKVVAWSPDGHTVASGSWDQTIRVWDASTGKCVQVFRNPSD